MPTMTADMSVRQAAQLSALAANPATAMQMQTLQAQRRMIIAETGTQPLAPPAPPGFERAASTLPISPSATPADSQLFEHATDAALRYWLPRYRLRQAQGRYEIASTLAADGLWEMRFGLEAVPAPELAGAAATAQVLPHRAEFAVRYVAAPSGIERRHAPASVAPDAAGTVLTLRLTQEEKDGLLRAFRSDAAGAQIAVARSIDVAVPLPASPRPPVVIRPRPMPVETPGPRRPLAMERAVVREQPAAARAQAMAAPAAMQSMAVRQAALPTAALAKRQALVAETQVEMQSMRVVRPVGSPPIMPPPPMEPPAPAPQRYDARHLVLEQSMPLRFDQADHPYLYAAGGGGAPAAEFERIVLRHPADDPRGRMHAYFRDVTQANRFYYVPDEFRLARYDEPPFVPMLVLRLDAGRNEDDTQVEMTCMLRPHVDARRLAAAAQALAAHVTVQGSAPPAPPQLAPLAARAKLRLALPRDGVVATVDAAANVDLANGMLVTERFALDDLQDVYAVLTGSGLSPLLRGSVDVHTGLAADELVPVQIHAAETEGELLVVTEAADPSGTGVLVTLRNATESPVRITALSAMLRRGGEAGPARLEGLDVSSPVTLAAGDQLAVTAQPLAPIGGEGAFDVMLDATGVQPLPDPKLLMPLLLDQSIAQETRRDVTVMTTAELLAGTAPENAVSMVVVEFRGNVNLTLDAATLQRRAEVPVPLIDVLLGRDTEGSYRWRQTVVYRQGGRSETSGWRDSDLGVLVVPQQG